MGYIYNEDSYKEIQINSFQSVADVEEEIVRKFKIGCGDLCGLYEEFSTNRERHLVEKARVVDILGEWEEFENPKYPNPRFVWKIKLVMLNTTKEVMDDPAIVDLLYKQAYHDVLTERYPVKHSAVTGLAALQLFVKYGDLGNTAREEWIKNLLPTLLPIAYLKVLGIETAENVFKPKRQKATSTKTHYVNSTGGTVRARRESITEGKNGDDGDNPRKNTGNENNFEYNYEEEARGRRITKGARRKSVAAELPSTWDKLQKGKDYWINQWVTKILGKYKSMCGCNYTAWDAKMNYLDQVQTWRLYGSTLWSVKQRQWSKFPSPLLLAINHDGLFFVDPETLNVLRNYQFNEIVTWGHTDAATILFVGDVMKKQKLILKSSNGAYISALIDDYIKFIIDYDGDQAVPAPPREDLIKHDEEVKFPGPPEIEDVPNPPLTRTHRKSK